MNGQTKLIFLRLASIPSVTVDPNIIPIDMPKVVGPASAPITVPTKIPAGIQSTDEFAVLRSGGEGCIEDVFCLTFEVSHAGVHFAEQCYWPQLSKEIAR